MTDLTITATYSPEDNKIRLYTSDRLDEETYERVKAAGFKWAPKQELFVAPKWSCKREDLALELAGEIEPEGTTLAERAQMKADRLDEIAAKRAAQASAFTRAARDISQRFEFGQPILIGHHSERKARKDKERMDNALSKAAKAHDAIGYWQYRAEGVERYANYKNNPKVRSRRIKTLLAELRDLQRNLNTAHKALDLWEKITTPEQIKLFLGRSDMHSYNLWSSVDRGEITPEEAREKAMAGARSIIESNNLSRWITHTLNRLAYEREMLGEVPRFEGEITPTLLQMFVREHGADKPKGAKVDVDLFTVECAAPLPAHIALGCSVELSSDEWRDLMQSCGYVPPAKKPTKPPILNFKAPDGKLRVKSRATYRGADPVETLEQVEVTKAEYSAIGSDYKGTRLSACGDFRIRYGRAPNSKEPSWRAPWVAFVITDQKQHPIPKSLAPAEAAQ
ncbi:DUF3560 domain-containing protein [Leisingera sp. ANG59]|uniref:DUF3560 domain-containing protein n=1 Tax=Leisingera sp. ANG59 TaxID=2675221 RepID=UPI0015740C2C|nr:DUF3560 domain-containing protein [Leisingera sp. ANG59]NSY39306.1 DUF3560 domain-containing protein [Leisingera sp. ANG59]